MDSSKDDDEKVVSIFVSKNRHKNNPNFRGALESKDPEFQNLVESYLSKVGSSTSESQRLKQEIGLKIMKYEIIDHMDLLIKLAILEIALGYGAASTNHHMIHENLMFIHFKQSMIGCMERTFADGQ